MIRLEDILDQVRVYAPDADLSIVRKAWVFASKYHRGQTRKSGEPYFAHPLEVANILAGLRMDVDTLAVACLHDTVEDTDATLEDIANKFGDSIAQMVDGVTKLNKLDFRTAEEAQAENFRKLVVAMAKDIRVIVVKLADRLHNMRTLGAMRAEKRARIARETMDLYAPLANRLGIVSLKGELEDLSFQNLHPEVHEELNSQLDARRPWFEDYIARVNDGLAAAVTPHIEGAQISGRLKRLWSIWQKMQEKELTFEEVDDLLAFRIIVDDLAQCYGALGIVHGLWAPVSERFKDYVAQPKTNGYRSLHTTVVGPEGQRIEVQIRTREMHDFGEYGIAAHWKYKEGKLALKPEEVEKYTKIRQLLQWAEDIEDSREFLDVLKVDLYADQVHVYTPRGDIRWFPMGATALDFAFAIHTEVGNRCAGARVNGRMVKLNYPLRSGDTVEIVTRTNQKPTRDWLQLAVTGRALSKIRQHLRKQEREQAVEMGRNLLDQELRKFGSTLKAVRKKDDLKAALDGLRHQRPDELFASVGYGRVDAVRVLPFYIAAEKLEEAKRKAEEAAGEEDAPGMSLTGLFRRVAKRRGSPVRIDGMDGLLVVFAKCCRPLPGDPIIGFVSRGRGITVHSADCRQGLSLPPERRVDVEWDAAYVAPHAARIHVVTVDRPMLLADVTKAIGNMNVNIQKADVRTTETDRGHITLDVAVNDTKQLRLLINSLARVKGVISVDRVRAG
jgi:GTP diphosphokinase / guanosine-3',5'-bis(diphosphate) 3'-diphosphatase